MRSSRLAAVTVALLCASLPAHAKKPKPPPCPAGPLVVDGGVQLGPAGVPALPDIVTVGADGAVSVASSCPSVPAKVKGKRRGTSVQAKWPKETCDGLEGKVKLKGKFDATCQTFAGKLKAKKHKVKFTATRPPSVTPVPEPERRVAETIGSAGGSVSATGSNGTVYTLDLPPGALVGDTEVALTPVSDIPDLPLSGDLAGAVEFEPDGLALLRTATLRIAPAGGATPPEGTALVGFASRSGQAFHLRLARGDDTEITVPIGHFSGGGAARADADTLEEEIEALQASVNAAAESFHSDLAALDPLVPGGDAILYGDFLAQTFDDVIAPLLEFGTGTELQDAAIALFRDWIFYAFHMGVAYDPVASGTAERLETGLDLAVENLRHRIDAANLFCSNHHEDGHTDRAMDEVREVLEAQRLAEGLFADADQPEELDFALLDRATVLGELCVQPVITSVDFTDSPTVGTPEFLEVEAQVSFGSADAEAPTVPLVVTATPIAGLDPATPASVDVSGPPFVLEAVYTPEAEQIELRVTACLLPDDPLFAGHCVEQLVGGTAETFVRESRVSAVLGNDIALDSFFGLGFSDLLAAAGGARAFETSFVEPQGDAIGAVASGEASSTNGQAFASILISFDTAADTPFVLRGSVQEACGSALLRWCVDGEDCVNSDLLELDGLLPGGRHSIEAQASASGSGRPGDDPCPIPFARGAANGSASYGFDLRWGAPCELPPGEDPNECDALCNCD